MFMKGRWRDKRVPVTTAWCVLWLRMEERPPVWRVAANIFNKQLQTPDKGWSSSLGVGRGVDNSSPWKLSLLRIMNTCLGTGLILWYDLSNEKGTCDLVCGMLVAGSLTAAARELARYKLDLVGVQEVRWDKGGTVRSGIIIFSDKIEKNEMGVACSAYGGEERRIQGFGGKTWGKETTWETKA